MWLAVSCFYAMIAGIIFSTGLSLKEKYSWAIIICTTIFWPLVIVYMFLENKNGTE